MGRMKQKGRLFAGQSLSPHAGMLCASVRIVEPQSREHIARLKKKAGVSAGRGVCLFLVWDAIRRGSDSRTTKP